MTPAELYAVLRELASIRAALDAIEATVKRALVPVENGRAPYCSFTPLREAMGEGDDVLSLMRRLREKLGEVS